MIRPFTGVITYNSHLVKLTKHPWKSMVGRWFISFWNNLCSWANHVSFREGKRWKGRLPPQSQPILKSVGSLFTAHTQLLFQKNGIPRKKKIGIHPTGLTNHQLLDIHRNILKPPPKTASYKVHLPCRETNSDMRYWLVHDGILPTALW